MGIISVIRNDIKSLRGATVEIFGQERTLSDSEVGEQQIDILNILNSLERFEAEDLVILVYNADNDEFEEEIVEDLSQYLDWLYEIGDLREVVSDNSYNWGSPVNHDFNFNIYENTMTGKYVVEFKVHRFGDVRGNYTESALLEFDSEYEFLEVLHESNKTISIGDYDVEISVFNDCFEVFKDGEYVKTICDLDDLDENQQEVI